MMKYLQMKFLWLCLLVYFTCSTANINAQISLTTSVTSYSQNFDALALSGTGNTWNNNNTLSGWFLFRQPAPGTAITTYNADNGGSNAGNFYSYGTASVNERAFGAAASGGAYFGSPASGAIAGWIAVAFTNNTGSTLNSATIGFDGEQWRNGGNATAQTMVLEYGFGTNFSDVTTWTAPGGNFDWVSPVATTTAAAIDGNVAGKVANRGGDLSGITWANGTNLWIRWVERNDSGNDHGLAIDNFSISISAGPDVTPPTFTSTYPKAGNIAQTSFDVLSNLNESGTTYFVVLANGAAIPNIAQVKAGQDASGTPLANNLKGIITNTNANTEYAGSASGLTASTTYNVYVVAEDNIPNTQTAGERIDVTTASITTPALTVNSTLTDFGSVNVNTTSASQNYTISGANLTDAVTVTAPTNFQVSKDNTTFSASITFTAAEVNANSQTIHARFAPTSGTNGAKSDNITHASTGISTQNQAVSGTETGNTAPYTENFNTCNGNVSSFSQISVTGTQKWNCTTFGNNSTNGVDMNGFSSGAAQTNEDWLITPLLSLNTNAVLTFFSKRDFTGADITVKISSNYDGTSLPSTATWADLTATLSSNPTGASAGPWTASGNVSLSAYNTQNVYIAFVYQSSTALGAARWNIDDVSVSNAVERSLTLSTANLGSFGFVASPNTSTSKSYTLLGKGLTNNVVVTAPANFEVSKDNTTFSNSITFTAAEVETAKSVYARFKPSATSIGTITGNITNVSGTFSKNVAVSGSEGTNPNVNTLEVVTYNVEWFAIAGNGPSDETLQAQNLKKVIQEIDADIYCLQEIGNENNRFTNFVTNDLVPIGYNGVRVSHTSTNGTADASIQARAFIYKTSVFSNIAATQLIASSTGWADGRFPAVFEADATINGVTKRLTFINVHAKAGATQTDYDRRKTASEVLKPELDANYSTDNIFFIGDYNDDLDVSIVSNQNSPYKNFVDDNTGYLDISKALSDANISSTFSFADIVDHITVSNEVAPAYIANSIQKVDVTTFITNAQSTLSDHFPIMASFNLANISTTPTLNTSVVTLADFGSVENGATSTSKSYTVSGTGLTADVIVTAPTSFKVSKDNITFIASVTFTAAEVNADAKTVHVQFAPTSGTAGAKSGNITHTSTGATQKDVAVSGTETLVPTLNTSVITLADFGSVENGTTSTSKSYTVSGTGLTADVIVTASTSFKVSKDNTTFTASVTFTATEVNAGAKTVHVQFAPTSGITGVKSGNITHTSTGATQKDVAVSGTETAVTALEESILQTLVVSPNPTSEIIRASIVKNISVKKTHLELYNLKGVKINQTDWQEKGEYFEGTFNLSTLPKGVYILKITDGKWNVSRKIVLE